MKLDELEVDDGGARAVRHRDAITRRDLRVCGFVIDLPCSASRKQHCSRECRRQFSVTGQETHPDAAAVFDDESDNARVIMRLDLWQLRRTFPENAADLSTRCIAHVKNAPGTVGRFHCERGFSIRRAIELNAPRAQFADESRTILHEYLDRGRIAQSIAGRHRVGGMQLRSIGRPNGRGNAALRVASVAFPRSAFREDENVAMTGDFGGRAKRGDAAADDEKVRAKLQAAPDAAILPSQK
jgi:hypothetical protein